MKLFTTTACTTIILDLLSCVAAASGSLPLPPGLPRSVAEFRKKHPYKPSKPHGQHFDGRHVVTIRPSANDTDDVSAAFKAGLERANHGGTLYLPANQTFVIGQPLDLTFLSDVHLRLDGEIQFTNDTAHWQSVAFTHPFQNTIMFWKWGGDKVKIYGEGVLNGNGQRWWNEFSGRQILDTSNTYLRPVLFYAENATDWVIEGISYLDSPCWNNFIVTSSGFEYKDIVVTALSNNASVVPANTDFFDSLNLDGLSVERTWVNIGDDCFSPKSNTTNIYVNNIYCNGTHGQSLGSIGQYSGEKSIIENVLIENAWMLNGQFGGRLKTWAGPDVGYGLINNVTFRNIWSANSQYSAYLDSCYFNVSSSTMTHPVNVPEWGDIRHLRLTCKQINASQCAAYPSQVNITNITFENFSGYTSGKYGRAVARLTCSTSPNAVCENIVFKNFTVTSPCGNGTDNAVVICDGVSGLGLPCVNSTSAEAVAALADTCTVPLATLSDTNLW